jgi:diadenosine tetraphosphate (Ap4A) HIT family hydrolase
MSDLPRLVRETSSKSSSPSDRAFSPSCPFCAITGTYPSVSPVSSPDEAASKLDPEKLDPPSFVLYSSEHVVAFLDIMPLTRGHVLVAPRKHRVKIGDLSPDEGAEVWLSSPACSVS